MITAVEFLQNRRDPLEIAKRHYKFAIEFASKAHFMKNYGILPYQAHLMDVESVLEAFGYCPETVEGYEYRICARLHDVCEDCGFTYNDIKKVFGKRVADICFCVQDEKGKNRSERKSDKLYNEMKEEEKAVILKLADRIANVLTSLETGEMINSYRKEAPDFKKKLYTEGVGDEMWKCLDILLA